MFYVNRQLATWIFCDCVWWWVWVFSFFLSFLFFLLLFPLSFSQLWLVDINKEKGGIPIDAQTKGGNGKWVS